MRKKNGRGRGAGPEGSRVRYGPTGGAQRIKTGGYQWSDEAEEAFFDHLEATCNVRASAEAVGFTTFTVYRQRRLRPEFAARWKLVLDRAYSRLELELVRTALDTLEGAEFDDERPIPKMTVEQAMNVLRAHRNEVNGSGRRGPGQAALPPLLEDRRPSILRKLNAIERHRRERSGGGGDEAAA